MKCPHCDEEITNEDELIQDALQAAFRFQIVEKISYTASQKMGLAAKGTFVVNGEKKYFSMAFDEYRRLISFQQNTTEPK